MFLFQKMRGAGANFFSRGTVLPVLYASIFQGAFCKTGFPQKRKNHNTQQVPVSSTKECARRRRPIFFLALALKAGNSLTRKFSHILRKTKVSER
jgi:hypothetical protein